MNLRRFLKTVLPLLLVFVMILTSCVSKPGDDPEDTHQHETSEEQTTDNQSPSTDPVCTHATTQLTGAVAATCAKEGYTGDKVCTACGTKVETGTKIDMLDHTWDNGVATKQPTCIATGVKTITCTGCFITKTETLAVVGHKDEFHFESDSVHQIVCSECHTSSSGAHKQGAVVETVARTCLEGAYTVYTCTDCKSNYKVYDANQTALGHDWDQENWVITPATCSSDGSQHMKCKNCDATTEPVVLFATAGVHTWGETPLSMTAATCTAAGSVVYKCQYCSETETKTLGKLGHSYGDPVVEDKWTHQTCTVCEHKVSSYDASEDVTANVTTNAIQEDKAFEVQLKDAAIEFPKEVVEQMKAEADVAIDAGILDETKKESAIANVTDEETKAILNQEGANIYSFEVTLGSTGDQKLANFEAPVTVTLTYTLGADEDPEGIVIWYVATNGELEAVTDVVFRDEDGDGEGIVVFEVAHFSYYAIAYRETPEMRCRRGNHDFSDEDLWNVVAPNCSNHGYTLKKCAVCGTATVDNMVVAKGHSYGEKQQPVVDCANGGYVYDRCADCGSIRTYEYVPAKGHTVATAATCETNAICTVCHAIVVPAKGHGWTEWEIVSEPTDVNSGLKRRYCPRCGEIETIKLAATGNVTPLEIESYEDLIALILEGVFNFGCGTLNLSCTMNGATMAVQMKVEESEAGYEGEIRFTMGENSEVMYYRNGVIIMSHPTGPDVDYGVLDPETLLEVPMELILEYAEQYFELVDAEIADDLIGICDFLAEKAAVENNGLDKVLAEYGSPYTVADLSKIMDSMQTVYAYLALKLGYATNAELQEGIEIPTRQDWHNVLGALTTATDVEGGKQYQLDAKNLLDSVDALLKWVEDNLDSTYAELLYELMGDFIVKSYPDLTDWDKLMAHIKTTYPGTKKLEDLINGIITVIEKTELCTMADIYAALDAMILEQTGEEVKVEDVVRQFSQMTLDEVAAMMMGEGATVAAIYDMVDQMMKTSKLGETVIGSTGAEDVPADREENNDDYISDGNGVIIGGGTSNGVIIGGGTSDGIIVDKDYVETDKTTDGEIIDKDYSEGDGFVENTPSTATDITVADQIQMLRTMFDSLAITAKVSVTLDKDGKLIGLSLEQTFGMVAEGQTQPIESLTLNIVNDSTVTVTLPDEIATELQDGAEFTYDAQGNLIISGLPKDGDVEIELGGNIHPLLKDALVYDKEWSNLLGYDVYVLDTALSSEYTDVGGFIQGPDGKLYEYTTKDVYGYYLVTGTVALKDILANPDAYLPADGATPVAYYMPEGMEMEGKPTLDALTPVYNTAMGHVYQVDGKWHLINREASKLEEHYYIEGVRYSVYVSIVSAPYTETVKSFVVSNTDDNWDTFKTVDGKEIQNVKNLHLTSSTAQDGDLYDNNVRVQFILKDGAIYLLTNQFVEYHTVYTVGKEATDVEYDRIANDYWWSSNSKIVLADGNDAVGYSFVMLEKKVKSLYAAYDGQYFKLTQTWTDGVANATVPFVKIDVSRMETLSLPDGRVLYVTLKDGDIAGTATVYGYVHVKNGAYVMTACKYVQNELQQIKYGTYRNYGINSAETSISISVRDLLENTEYVTANADGTYTVSGEIIKLIKSYCADNGDSFSVGVRGAYENNGTTCILMQQHVLYFHAYTLATQGDSNNFYPSWYEGFGSFIDNDGYNYFEIIQNQDGTVTVKMDEEYMVDIEFSFTNTKELTTMDVMTPNEEKSKETGLDIYTATEIDTRTAIYLYLGGKYYNYYWYDKYIINDYTNVTPEELVRSAWTIGDLDYRFDEVSEDGKTLVGRVYYGSLSLSLPFGSFYDSIYSYFQIIDGELYVLTGVSNETEVGIKYEGKVPVQEYLDSLRLVEDKGYLFSSETYLKNGTVVKNVGFSLYEGDRFLGTLYVPCYTNADGGNQPIVIHDFTTLRMIRYGSEVTLPTDKVLLRNYTETDGDGKVYTLHYFFYTLKITTDYVRVGDSFISYENYNHAAQSKESFLNNMADEIYIYGVKTNDVWSYYASAEFTFTDKGDVVYILGKPLSDVDVSMLDEKYNYLGQSENGEIVYQFTLYSVSDLVSETIGNVTFWHKSGESYGYAEMQDGKYVACRLVENADGKYTLQSDWSTGDMLKNEFIVGALNLRDYIDFNGNEAVISPELIKALKDYPSVQFCVVRYSEHGSMNGGNLSYEDLAAYFNK